jgi:hypothetical protein
VKYSYEHYSNPKNKYLAWTAFFSPPITLSNMSHCRSNSWNLFIVCATMMIQCKRYAVLIKAKYSALGVSTQPHKLYHYSFTILGKPAMMNNNNPHVKISKTTWPQIENIIVPIEIGVWFHGCRVDKAICIFDSDRPEETIRKVKFCHEVII